LRILIYLLFGKLNFAQGTKYTMFNRNEDTRIEVTSFPLIMGNDVATIFKTYKNDTLIQQQIIYQNSFIKERTEFYENDIIKALERYTEVESNVELCQ
jgi:SRSO17 transposase